MIGSNTLFSWLIIVTNPVVPAAKVQSWVMPLAYVAAIVFIIIILAAIYLMILSVKQQRSEDRD